MAGFANFIQGDAIRQRQEEMELRKLIAISQNPGNFGAAAAGNAVAGAVNSAFGLVTPKTKELSRLAQRQDVMMKMMNSGVELGTPEAEEMAMALFGNNIEDALAFKIQNDQLMQQRQVEQLAAEDRQFEQQLKLSKENRARAKEARDAQAFPLEQRAAEIEAALKELQLVGEIRKNSPEARAQAAIKKQAEQLKKDSEALQKIKTNMDKDPAIKDYTGAALSSQSLEAGISDPSGLGDIMLIKAMVQIQEPGLSVNSQEFNSVEGAAGFAERLGFTPGNFENGRFLSDRQRQRLVSLGVEVLNQKFQEAAKARGFFVKQATRKGLSPEDLPQLIQPQSLQVPDTGLSGEVNEQFNFEIQEIVDEVKEQSTRLLQDPLGEINRQLEETTGIPTIDKKLLKKAERKLRSLLKR